MDWIDNFIGWVGDVYTFPFRQYEAYDPSQRDWVWTGITGITIYGITLVIVVPLVWWSLGRIRWITQRQHCQHAECNHSWTTSVSDSFSEPGCIAGHPCCGACVERHVNAAIQRQADREPRRICPDDGAAMDKVVTRRVVQDVCNRCGGLFLDKDELDTLNALFREDGYRSGHADGVSSGRTAGIFIGAAIG